MVKIKINFSDGSYDSYENNDINFSDRLSELQSKGYEGKKLIDMLITDDWGVPPLSVLIKHESTSKKYVDITIPYI